MTLRKIGRTPMHCSFCGKEQKEVRYLIAGPTTFICDECTALCASIIAECDAAKAAEKAKEGT